MEPKKSIRDITSSNSNNIISDIVSEKPVVKKTRKIEDISQTPNEEYTSPKPLKINKGKMFNMGKIKNILLQIRPIYLIAFLLILVLGATLIFVPSPYSKDPVEQSKKEAEVVKKQLSKLIVLPDNEQIDIRKITSKVEDPFFQNAEIGDYLVIFYENRIAFIYSIDKNIIVNAGVVFIDPKTATTTSTTSTQ